MLHDVAQSREKAVQTAVLLCGGLAELGTGLNLAELRSLLESSILGITVQVVPDLRRNPALLSSVVARQGASRLVLGLCSGEYSQVDLHAGARKTGLDPFGIQVVPLGTLCAMVHPEPQATWKARALLAAAVARARAFQGSGPEHAKLYFLPLDQRVTRRSLFTVPPVGYRPVPSVRGDQCAAEAGCRLCASACPRDALQETGGRLAISKTRCEGCGVCLAACPREAIEFPGWSLSQFEAQLDALLDSAAGGDPVGILLTCQRAGDELEELARWEASYSHCWLPVVVPCLGMVTPTWILQTLAHGADAVSLLSCDADCPFGQQQAIGGRVNFCRRLLDRLEQRERVRVLSASHSARLLQALQEAPPRQERDHHARSRHRLRLGTCDSAFQAIRCLADADGGLPTVTLEHPYSPFGVLEFQGEGCTACLACVEACPTGALASERSGNGVSLTWLASSCTGCGMCADICPETAAQVLRVRRITNLDTLSLGRVALHEDRLATCQECGAAIASQALLRRIEASLGEGGDDALLTALSRYCSSCRLSFAWGATTRGESHN